ncbi:hypothetical protein BX600DRAFT_467738 [Xylariales sp. PMI_506]|nr:hypothetical protein BX600DRAFT_467738 [Xylariales sp. PMI_506]
MVAYKSFTLFLLALGAEAKQCSSVFPSERSTFTRSIVTSRGSSSSRSSSAVHSSSSGYCASLLGGVKVDNIPTGSSTVTKTITHTSTALASGPTVTLTPSPAHRTVTSTDIVTDTITADAEVDTATTILTNVNTITSTNTVIEIETDTTTTTTTSTSTSTVAAPADFTPISEESEYVARRRGRTLTSPSVCKAGASGPEFSPTAYVQSVKCVSTVYQTRTVTTTVTGKTHTVTAHRSTITSTDIIISTSTTTSYPPDVTDTETITTSTDFITILDVTTTTTLTSTVTSSTEVEAATPFYAVCGSSNLISTANGGQAITELQTRNPTNFLGVSGITSAYDCCVACFNEYGSTCGGSLMYLTSSCLIFSQTTCTNGAYNNNEFFTSSSGASYTISNGPCGLIANGGEA